MRFIGVRTWKTGIGAVIAMIIAKELGLSYWVSAGIITILSIQSTKKRIIKDSYKENRICYYSLNSVFSFILSIRV